MFTISVIPLARGSNLDCLTYFSKHEYPLGTLLQVPVRSRQLTGIVIKSEAVSTAKTALRSATFSLKKLPPQKQVTSLPPSFMETAQSITKNTPYSLSSILHTLLPTDIRNGDTPYPLLTPDLRIPEFEYLEPQVLLASSSDRLVAYQSIIRKVFAQEQSVLLVTPHTITAEYLRDRLGKGIKDRLVCLTTHQSKKQRIEAYQGFMDSSQSKLIIANPNFAFLDRADISTIIIDESASPQYQLLTRPYLDYVELLKHWTKTTKQNLILSDLLIHPEDEQKRRDDFYQSLGEFPKRLPHRCKIDIDVAEKRTSHEQPFQLFTTTNLQKIKDVLAGRNNVFIHAAHRGLAPVVACLDCGETARDPDSGSPFSLLRTHDSEGNEKRWFVSATSGRRIPAADTCAYCGSWRLRERGLGIQYIVEELKATLGEVPLLVFDHLSAGTYPKAKKLAKEISDAKGVLIIGTSMIIPYLSDNLHLSIISSVDALRSTPTWRADELLMRSLLQIAEKTTHQMIVQTRQEPDGLLKYAVQGAIEKYYNDELALREQLHYPPFTNFFLLTWQGKSEAIQKIEAFLKDLLVDYKKESQFYYSPLMTKNGSRTRHCLLRTPRGRDTTSLLEKLRGLPPVVAMRLNPDRII